MKEVIKQLSIIDDVIANIEMAEDRKKHILKCFDNYVMFKLFGEKKLYEKLTIKQKAVNYWNRRLKKEVNKLNEQIKHKTNGNRTN